MSPHHVWGGNGNRLDLIRRRDFLRQSATLSASMLAGAPWLAACTKSGYDDHASIRIGYLTTGRTTAPNLRALGRELAAHSWMNRTPHFQFIERCANFKLEDLERLCIDLFASGAAILFCADLTAALAAKSARRESPVPIVFLAHADPVAAGLVESMSKPGVDITGVTTYRCVDHKMIEIIKEALPGIQRLGYVGEFSSYEDDCRTRASDAADHLHLALVRIDVVEGESGDEIVSSISRARPDAVVIPASTPVWHASAEVVRGLGEIRMPAIFESALFIEQGGLMYYGPAPSNDLARVAAAILRVLRGERAGEIPVDQPSRFELTINLHAAHGRDYGLSRSVLQRADRILE